MKKEKIEASFYYYYFLIILEINSNFDFRLGDQFGVKNLISIFTISN